ncbi:MAG: hypothetical protein ACE3JK_12405 [Sporolactobacillus sp.]
MLINQGKSGCTLAFYQTMKAAGMKGVVVKVSAGNTLLDLAASVNRPMLIKRGWWSRHIVSRSLPVKKVWLARYNGGTTEPIWYSGNRGMWQ